MSNDKDIEVNTLVINGGRNCKAGAIASQQSPDLWVKGGAIVGKDLCIGGNIGATNFIVGESIIAGNLSVPILFDGDFEVPDGAVWFGGDVTFTGNVYGIGGGGISCGPLSFVFYVAQNGNDTTGDGSACNPFLTIQKGIDTAYSVASISNRSVVWVMPGLYTENLVLKANVLIKGMGFNNTRLAGPGGGSLVIDSTFTPAGDHRSGVFDCGVGLTTIDFQAVSSNEGKVVFQNCRMSAAVTLVGFSSINQVMFMSCEIFGNITQTGVNATMTAVLAQNTPTYTCNYSPAGANSLLISGGTYFRVVVNGVGGTFNLTLSTCVKAGGSLALNGANALVTAVTSAVPRQSNITFSGGASLAQISLMNDAGGLAFTPSNLSQWNGVAPTSVANALNRIAATVGLIL